MTSFDVGSSLKKTANKGLRRLLWSLLAGNTGNLVVVIIVIMLVFSILMSISQTINSLIPHFGRGSSVSEIGKSEIPSQYLEYYYGAERQYGVPWNILAGVHRVETTFSTDQKMVSSVGAIGHMQFMPKTWIGWSYPGGTNLGDADIPDSILTNPEEIAKYGGYGTDANGDGRADPYDLMDAIYSAAKYLAANGGSPFDPQKALIAYNHEQVYVDSVLGYANQYAEGFEAVEVNQGASLPYESISREWMDTIEWVDPVSGKKVKGLSAELKTQAAARGISVPTSVVTLLAEDSGRVKKEEKAKEYATLLAPRELKVIVVKKTGTITKTTTVPAATAAPAATGSTKAGEPSASAPAAPQTTTTTSPIEEDLLFISSVKTWKGVYTYQVAYDEQRTDNTDSSTGTSTSSVIKSPILSQIDLNENEEIFDAVLKKAHIRGKEAKADFIEMVQLIDPSFYTGNIEIGNDIIIPDSSGGALQWPVAGYFKISSPFGNRTHPVTGEIGSFHQGVDIPVPLGTPVVASADGIVEIVGSTPIAGNFVKLNHGSLHTRYLHLNRVLVKSGEMVKRGQVIAESGNTGRSTGPHLHYEVQSNNQLVDPLTFYQNSVGGSIK